MVQPYNLMANHLCKVSSQQVYHYQTICDGVMTGIPMLLRAVAAV